MTGRPPVRPPATRRPRRLRLQPVPRICPVCLTDLARFACPDDCPTRGAR